MNNSLNVTYVICLLHDQLHVCARVRSGSHFSRRSSAVQKGCLTVGPLPGPILASPSVAGNVSIHIRQLRRESSGVRYSVRRFRMVDVLFPVV